MTEQQRTMLAFIGGRRDTYYLLSEAFRLTGPVDPARLRAALGLVLSRHQVLRSVFPQEGDHCALVFDRSGLPTEASEAEAFEAETFEQEAGFPSVAAAARAGLDRATRPMELDRGPLLRVWLGRVSPTESVLVVAGHHLVVDRWGFRLLYRELAHGYRDLAGLAASAAPPQYWPPTTGPDRGHPDRAELFGRDYRAVRALSRAASTPRGPAGVHRKRFGGEPARLLTTAAARLSVTPYLIGLAALLGALSEVLGDPEVIVGTSFSGRTDSRSLRAMGYFSTSVFLGARLTVPPGPALVRELERQLADWRLSPRRQWEGLLAEHRAEDLFPVKFGLEPAEAAGPGPDLDGVVVERIDEPVAEPAGTAPTARRPLDIDVEYDRDALWIATTYRTDAVPPALVEDLTERFAEHLRRLATPPVGQP
ncbi:condensation domain-containing protein [Kitasatospora sp. MMS16-BH015]|uniref:condensation domain-containing protein n=1 Tax=Kitasatospora sp. MMS16-BH015 TaxID=2018025 RepID=UPI00131A4C05|nr:condensation domain-containing protein [Kitasatospora sp. MMS16-BH015]